ncbi:DUF4198 domain-containing protein [Uliginosibacterium sediminicola]|uniref:DUF4198 domain-containing protein n=1 Tax=Uliginosibacterium sediminicola TaxID=2024550 RepID=A0ABU9YUJ3_9RHOO
MHPTRLLVTALAALSFSHSFAHGIWFAQRSDETALIYGHASEDSSTVKRANKITSYKAYRADGSAINGELQKTDYLMIAKTAEPAALHTATLDNGLWSQAPDGQWINKGKDEVAGAKVSGRYLKYTMGFSGLPFALAKPLADQRLQLVPQHFPFPSQRGSKQSFKVLFDGKPVAGAKVSVDYINDADAKPLVSGRDGSVRFAIRNQGLNVIAISYESAPDDARKADKTGHFATLSFVLPHHEE